jgi:hypothetical protein
MHSRPAAVARSNAPRSPIFAPRKRGEGVCHTLLVIAGGVEATLDSKSDSSPYVFNSG